MDGHSSCNLEDFFLTLWRKERNRVRVCHELLMWDLCCVVKTDGLKFEGVGIASINLLLPKP